MTIETVNRLIHYYELSFTFRTDFQPSDGNQLRELFSIVIALAKSKSHLRYQVFGEKAIFMKDVKIDPVNSQVSGKLLSIRKNILPEIMNTVTDESRGIDAKDEEGLLETTHFIIDFQKRKKKLAIEYNQFGAKVIDFVSYLKTIGIAKKALSNVNHVPIIKDNLKDLMKRVNRTSEFTARIHKDNLQSIKDVHAGLFSMFKASIDQFKSEYGTVILKFDYRQRADTREINSVVNDVAINLIKNPENSEYFETLEMRAEDTENNNRLEFFDLLVDKIRHRVTVQKKERYRTVISEDILSQMKEKIKTVK